MLKLKLMQSFFKINSFASVFEEVRTQFQLDIFLKTYSSEQLLFQKSSDGNLTQFSIKNLLYCKINKL